MNKTAVSVSEVSVFLNGGFPALKGISLDIPAGKIMGFIGPSGAGKTTLMRSIVGRQKISGGSITIFDLPAGSAKLREEVSYMTQEISVYSDLTVQENISYFATMFGIKRKEISRVVAQVLKTVQMEDKADQLVAQLSGGQKQRVSLAISLIGAPMLLVLDEPTVGLDPLLREQLWALFRHLAEKGTTLIISSHVMDEAERCDDLLLIRDGQVLAQGTPHQLRERTHTATVEQSFLALVGGGK